MYTQVVDAHRDVERKAVLQMLAISLLPQTPSAAPSSATLKDSSSGGSLEDKTQQQEQQHMQDTQDSIRLQASQLLLSLTVDGVNVLSLPNARLRCQVGRAIVWLRLCSWLCTIYVCSGNVCFLWLMRESTMSCSRGCSRSSTKLVAPPLMFCKDRGKGSCKGAA